MDDSGWTSWERIGPERTVRATNGRTEEAMMPGEASGAGQVRGQQWAG